MKHYGIWIIEENGWLAGMTGTIFETTSRAVAEAQLTLNICNGIDCEVREFPQNDEDMESEKRIAAYLKMFARWDSFYGGLRLYP